VVVVSEGMCLLDHIFDDKRVAITILTMWMVAVVGSLQSINLLQSEFMTFGPSNHTRFMTVSIDSWHKWWLLAIATFTNTCVTSFMSDAIAPWLQNTIQDHKTKYLPYNKYTCFMISQLWDVYCNVMSIFSVALMMSQIDFLAIRMAADLLTNTFTCYKFMRHKVTNRTRYNMWNEEQICTSFDHQLLEPETSVGAL